MQEKVVLNDVIICNISLFGKKLTAAQWSVKKLENIHSLPFFLWFSYLEQELKSKKIYNNKLDKSWKAKCEQWPKVELTSFELVTAK